MFQHVILSTSIKCCVHPKVDKRIKDAIVEFIVNRLVNDLDNEEEEPYPQKNVSRANAQRTDQASKKDPCH